jgi:hypothetical protein
VRRLLLLAAAGLAVLAGVAALPATARAGIWCGGTAESATDRPDALAALAWHVIYAYPSDGSDRFAQLVEPIVADLSAIDAWWRGQDATRAIRWDIAALPGCATGVAAVDLSAVRLPGDTAAYRGSGRYARLRDDLVAAGFGDPDKKVLVFYDGALDQPLHECGVARTGFPATGGADSYAFLYLDSSCGTGLGAGEFPAVAAIHEMTHSMYALVAPSPGQPGPPHACPDDTGHPCDDPSDLLYPSSQLGVRLASKLLDVGRDDYYGHSGSWWDVQDSLFLERLDSADAQPPAAPAGLEARGITGAVLVSWQAAADDVGPVSYEVFRDGVQLTVTSALSYSESIAPGETYSYGVRSRDAVGRLGGSVAIRFAGGIGVVDAAGQPLADTVPPSPVARLRARLTRLALFLTWSPATDAGGVAGYRVYRDDRRVATTRVPVFSLPARRGAGTWYVRPFDRTGNLGDPSPVVTVQARVS